MTKKGSAISALFIILFAHAASSTRAQSSEKIIASARYRFSQLEDTALPGSLRTQYMQLDIGRESSRYRKASDRQADSNHWRFAAETVEVDNGDNGTSYFLYSSSHKAYQSEKMFMYNYIFEIQYPGIDWTIASDTTTIGGYICQMARGRWKGRLYTAWFCPDLPFPYGPWKLRGLPGLILQAADSSGQIVFEFAGFFKNPNPDASLQLPSDHPVRVTQREFNRLHQLFTDNPKAYLQSVFGPAAMGSVKIDPSFHGDRKINNPIERDVEK